MTRASRSSRWRSASSFVRWAGKTLIATSRSRRLSRPRYTSPIPPAPRADTISYGPSRVPGASAIEAQDSRVVGRPVAVSPVAGISATARGARLVEARRRRRAPARSLPRPGHGRAVGPHLELGHLAVGFHVGLVVLELAPLGDGLD